MEEADLPARAGLHVAHQGDLGDFHGKPGKGVDGRLAPVQLHLGDPGDDAEADAELVRHPIADVGIDVHRGEHRLRADEPSGKVVGVPVHLDDEIVTVDFLPSDHMPSAESDR